MGAVRERPTFRYFQRLSSGQDFDSRESLLAVFRISEKVSLQPEVLRALVQARVADVDAASLQ